MAANPTPQNNPEEHLFVQIKQMLDNARRQIARTVNSITVEAYWQVGRYIVEYEQLVLSNSPHSV